MFYAHFVLSKRGPLAKIWLAAHWEKKLTKAQVYETNIDSTVEAILEPKVKLALRTSGHLLLGVVRIYSRKAKYLLADCNEAFVKIKMAFRPGAVDLPDEHREAAASAITLQENFEDFDVNFNDFEMDAMEVAPKFAINQSRPEEITIKEDVGHINFITDDGFGDVGFDDREMLREASSIEDSLFQTPAPIGDASTILAADETHHTDVTLTEQEKMVENDGFGDEDGLDADFIGGAGGLFEDITMEPPEVSSIDPPPADTSAAAKEVEAPVPPPGIDVPEESTIQSQTATTSALLPTMTTDSTTLLTNDAEAFALEPLDNTSVVGGASTTATERKAKRRRKLMVDEQKGIDSQSMKEQLFQTNDIVTTLDLAPPTRKLMQWKESGTVDKLFTLPARLVPTKALEKLFTRNLSVALPTEEEEKQRSRKEKSPEHDRHEQTEQPSTNNDFALPAIPDAPEFNDTANTVQSTELPPPEGAAVPTEPADEVTDEAPRKRQRLDRSSVAAPAAAEVDSADEGDMEAPTLEERESAIVAEESTGDAVEDKRLNRRTHSMLTTLGKQFDREESANLLDMLRKNHSRKQVAAKFYTCLVLKKHCMIDVEQSHPYADIILSRGTNFAKSG